MRHQFVWIEIEISGQSAKNPLRMGCDAFPVSCAEDLLFGRWPIAIGRPVNQRFGTCSTCWHCLQHCIAPFEMHTINLDSINRSIELVTPLTLLSPLYRWKRWNRKWFVSCCVVVPFYIFVRFMFFSLVFCFMCAQRKQSSHTHRDTETFIFICIRIALNDLERMM